MNIYNYDGTVLLEARLTSAAQREESFTDDFIKLSWSDVTRTNIPAGAYIIYNDLHYLLLEPYEPTQKSTAEYAYDPQFKHPKMLLSKRPLYLATYDNAGNAIEESDWEMVDNALNILNYICLKIDDVFGIDSTDLTKAWGAVIPDSTDLSSSEMVSFASVDILSGINAVATAFEAEYYLDWENHTLYFGKCLSLTQASPVTLEVGNNVQVASVSTSKDGYYNCFEAKGSTRNIWQKSESTGENISLNTRLTLSPTDYPLGYIDLRESEEEPMMKKILIFDDIYPKLDLYCYNVRERQRYLLDDDNNKVVSYYDDNGNPVYQKYSVWYVRLAYPIYTVDSEGNKTVSSWQDFSVSGRTEPPFTTVQLLMITEDTKLTILTNLEYKATYFSAASEAIGDDAANGYGFPISIKINNKTIACWAYKYQSNVAVTAIGDEEDITALKKSITVGNKLYFMSNVYRAVFPTSCFESESDTLLLAGYELTASFEANEWAGHSALAGREFKMTFHDSATTIYANEETGDTGVEVLEGDYEINFEKEGSSELIIPTTSEQFLVPYGEGKTLSDLMKKITLNNETVVQGLANDRVVLFNLAMPESYKEQAYSDLEEALKKEITLRYSDQNNYTFKSNPIYFEANNPNLFIGESAIYKNFGYELETRITKLVTKIDHPFEQEITVGNVKVTSNTQTLKEDVKSANANINLLRLLTNSANQKVDAYYRALLQMIQLYTESNNSKLSKVSADEAAGLITFLKGIAFGKDGTYGIDETGKATLLNVVTDYLTVTKSAHFFELIIDKIKAAGGAFILTPADGFKTKLIEKVTKDDEVTGYKLYFLAEDDENAISNMWKVGDQALCMTFNAAEGTSYDVSNKFWWRLVTETDETPVELDGTKYHYIVVSATDKADDLTGYDSVPEVGDEVSMLGYRYSDDEERQSAIYMSAYTSLDKGLTAPLFAQYKGINDYDLESHRNSYFDATSAKFVGDIELSSGSTFKEQVEELIEDSGTNYNVSLSAYTDVVEIDDDKQCVKNGLWTDVDGNKQYKISSAIYVLNGEKILTETTDSDSLGKGKYMVTLINGIGCSCTYANGTVYITGIDNVLDGVTNIKPEGFVFDSECNEAKVEITVNCEGKAVKTLDMPLTLKHSSFPYSVDFLPSTVVFDSDSSGLVSGSKTSTMLVRKSNEIWTDYTAEVKGTENCSAKWDADSQTITISDIATKEYEIENTNTKKTTEEDSEEDSEEESTSSTITMSVDNGSVTMAVTIGDVVLEKVLYFRCNVQATVAYIKVGNDKIELKVNDITDGLEATGIDIENKKITLTSDSVVVKNNAGKLSAIIDSDGQLIAQTLTTADNGNGYISIKNGILSAFTHGGILQMQIGVDELGRRCISFYDEEGNFAYDIGPDGISARDVVEEKWWSILGITVAALCDDVSTKITTDIASIVADKSAMKDLFTYNKTGTESTYYKYIAAQVNGVYVKGTYTTAENAAEYDKKYFSKKDVCTDDILLNGLYTEANGESFGTWAGGTIESADYKKYSDSYVYPVDFTKTVCQKKIWIYKDGVVTPFLIFMNESDVELINALQ